jgi:hypothetical protein
MKSESSNIIRLFRYALAGQVAPFKLLRQYVSGTPPLARQGRWHGVTATRLGLEGGTPIQSYESITLIMGFMAQTSSKR